MEEYYKIRYNLYKYFMNIDSNTYDIYIYIFIINIIILGILLPILLISVIKNVNIYILIFVLFIILFYYISYKLYYLFINIQNNNELKSYKLLYEILNIIYRENKETIKDINKFKNMEKDILKPNIRNIENIYDDNKINNLILKSENNNDIIKYYDLDDYLNNDNAFNLLYNKEDTKSFITTIGGINDYINYTYKYDPDNTRIQIKLNILFDKNRIIDDNIIETRNKLLKYINKKYNKNLSTLYINLDINDKKFLYKDLIKTLKSNILYYTIIVCYFILIMLHGLFINLNILLTYIYILIITILIFIMYYYN
jgi:hypothetical protein